MGPRERGRSWRTVPQNWIRPHQGQAASGGWRAVTPQVLLIGAALVLYYLVRAVSGGSEIEAVANAHDVLAFERALGFDWELGAQELVLSRPALVSFFNWVYVWTYWPLLLGALIYLWCRRRREFTVMRDALIVSGAMGLVIFALYPVAPPRFLGDFTDTVAQASREHFIAHPSGLINQYAALPSFHLGWHVLAGVMLAQLLPRRWRVLPLVPAMLMGAAIVVTGNHYIIDGVVGVALSLAGLAVARRLHAGQETPAPSTQSLAWARIDPLPDRPPGHRARDVA